MANGAVFSFVIFHGDFEHVVASDANPVDLGGWIGTRFGYGAVRGMAAVLRFAHERILARQRMQSIMAQWLIGKGHWSERFAKVQAAWPAFNSSRTRLTIWPMLTGR